MRGVAWNLAVIAEIRSSLENYGEKTTLEEFDLTHGQLAYIKRTYLPKSVLDRGRPKGSKSGPRDPDRYLFTLELIIEGWGPTEIGRMTGGHTRQSTRAYINDHGLLLQAYKEND